MATRHIQVKDTDVVLVLTNREAEALRQLLAFCNVDTHGAEVRRAYKKLRVVTGDI